VRRWFVSAIQQPYCPCSKQRYRQLAAMAETHESSHKGNGIWGPPCVCGRDLEMVVALDKPTSWCAVRTRRSSSCCLLRTGTRRETTRDASCAPSPSNYHATWGGGEAPPIGAVRAPWWPQDPSPVPCRAWWGAERARRRRLALAACGVAVAVAAGRQNLQAGQLARPGPSPISCCPSS
jgi:hypothetical protein